MKNCCVSKFGFVKFLCGLLSAVAVVLCMANEASALQDVGFAEFCGFKAGEMRKDGKIGDLEQIETKPRKRFRKFDAVGLKYTKDGRLCEIFALEKVSGTKPAAAKKEFQECIKWFEKAGISKHALSEQRDWSDETGGLWNGFRAINAQDGMVRSSVQLAVRYVDPKLWGPKDSKKTGWLVSVWIVWKDVDKLALNAGAKSKQSNKKIPEKAKGKAASEAVHGVQLWENGPYWAECNVGAKKPEERGYYFWWGDTVGYTNTGSRWISVKDRTEISFLDSGVSASTYEKDNAALMSAGYIDATGNLVASHDAATAHLGASWRMPTEAEISALFANTTTKSATINGVPGRLVKGKGDYEDRSIFLPTTGSAVSSGYDSGIGSPFREGVYLSSTPDSRPSCVRCLRLDKYAFWWLGGCRYYGRPVRPVRAPVKNRTK